MSHSRELPCAEHLFDEDIICARRGGHFCVRMAEANAVEEISRVRRSLEESPYVGDIGRRHGVLRSDDGPEFKPIVDLDDDFFGTVWGTCVLQGSNGNCVAAPRPSYRIRP